MPATKQTPENTLLVDMHEAGRLVGVSYWTIYALVKQRELPVVEVRGKFFIRRSTLVRWIEKSEGKVAA